MKIDGQRRSDNFEDRGTGRRSGGRGGAGGSLLFFVVRRFGLPGVVVAGLGLLGIFFFAPEGIQQVVFGALFGGPVSSGAAPSGGAGDSACSASSSNAAACDFSRVILASTEDVWGAQFGQGRLPSYGGSAAGAYQPPTLVVFAQAVSTGGCGDAGSDAGPFYCPADRRLYIDPSFYDVMARQLRAPGDFAQAYVLAHEVGHHVQNVIGATRVGVPGESEPQTSVRVELQADCFAGVWGHSARSSLQVSDEDLAEATRAAHAIGDDTLGHRDEATFTHGSSEQRIRWFRRGYESGDPRQCDTFSVRDHAAL
ncbi:MAG: neutral zinc metallopeptidase [Deltaproteobacteria bacterium]|nr:neutral zinc metallopeptidase [Deltaproteobacteria bacterium]